MVSSSLSSSSSVREIEKVMDTLHMNGGVGETSYAKNSDVQGKIIKMGKHIVEEAIVKSLYSREGIPKSFSMADLGCSSGPNTLTVVWEIIDAMHKKCADMGCQIPELRVSLNDLPTNDFNNIFESLPEFYRKLTAEKGMDSSSCFISGVPGSFYGRLFPRESLHFVHSSSSLHWLSQVPASLEIGEHHSPRIMNKGHIYISKGSPEGLFEAYSEQFQKDFRVFLESRSIEMVRGGRMVISLMGRSTQDPTTESAYLWELLAQALMTLACEGVVEEEKVHSFNAPYYAPCVDELLKLIHMDASFTVDRIHTFRAEWDCSDVDNSDSFSITRRGERVGKMVRAVVESLMESHFGMDIMDLLFDRFALLAQDHLMKYRTNNTVVVLSLLRKL